MIAFLDLLRDRLCENYGDDITTMLQAADNSPVDEQQTELAFDDDLDF